MRRKLLFAALLFGGVVSYAQEVSKVPAQETFDYSRCAISIISMGGGAFTQGIDSCEFMSGKFDINKIPCTQIPVVGNEIVGKKKQVLKEKAEEIRKELLAKNVGKQILDYWLQYDGSVFNSSLLAKRTRYSKTDADVLNANADKVNTLNVADKRLIGNSYVVVLSESEDAKGVDVYVYHTILPEGILTEVWNNWLDEDASPANKSFYETLRVDLQLVAAINKKYEKPASYVLYASSILAGDLGSSLRKMAASSSAIDPMETLNKVLEVLEHKIDKWQVTGTIFHRHPIAAKIGRKEGLRNSDRYRVFKVVEDEDADAAERAGELLSQINPQSPAYAKAKVLFASIKKRISALDAREWKYKLQEQRNEHALNQARIAAARAIGTAWAKNRPRIVYHVHNWW